jgi:uncharacterized protein YdeI (YjbR/CyaY-like superfamily)
MPEELAEVLAQDPESDAAFHRLTPGRRRTLIYSVASARSVDNRIKRALQAAETAKVEAAKK